MWLQDLSVSSSVWKGSRCRFAFESPHLLFFPSCFPIPKLSPLARFPPPISSPRGYLSFPLRPFDFSAESLSVNERAGQMEKSDRIRNFAKLFRDYSSPWPGQVLGIVSEGNLEWFMENCWTNTSQYPDPPHKPDIQTCRDELPNKSWESHSPGFVKLYVHTNSSPCKTYQLFQFCQSKACVKELFR